jgi:hypothetical protein
MIINAPNYELRTQNSEEMIINAPNYELRTQNYV